MESRIRRPQAAKGESPAVYGGEGGPQEAQSVVDTTGIHPKTNFGSVRDVGFFQERNELLLKGPFAMVFFLSEEIRDRCVTSRFTHAKSTVPLLPRKAPSPFIYPFRRVSLHMLKHLG